MIRRAIYALENWIETETDRYVKAFKIAVAATVLGSIWTTIMWTFMRVIT